MIALIDYDAGNTCSVMNALDRLKADYVLTEDKNRIATAEKVIFPGVGHAGSAMEALRKKELVEVIKNLKQPVLGICVGMQLMADYSDEGNIPCLGIVPGRVVKFEAAEGLKVPHMGWNQVNHKKPDLLFDEIEEAAYFYFVHSYYMPLNEFTISSCNYGLDFSCAIRKDNFIGIQFHAEKSGDIGALLLKNFISGKI